MISSSIFSKWEGQGRAGARRGDPVLPSHPTPSLPLPCPAPSPGGPGTYPFISTGSLFSSKPRGFGDRMVWKSESAGMKAICRAKGSHFCGCSRPWPRLHCDHAPIVSTRPGRGPAREGSPLDRRGACSGPRTRVRGSLGSCSHLALHSPNKLLLSTYCVPSILLGPRGQQAVRKTSLPWRNSHLVISPGSLSSAQNVPGSEEELHPQLVNEWKAGHCQVLAQRLTWGVETCMAGVVPTNLCP